MKKNIATKLNEFVDNHKNIDMIIELAKINRDELPFDVCVFGGNSYGSGRSEHGEPHFHISDNINKPDKFKISILIPTINDWKNNKELLIIANDSTQNTWDGLNRIKKMLTEWLSLPNYKNKKTSNLYRIIDFWNSLNIDNKNVRQIEDNGEDLF
jgi:hypothetical protein